MTIRYYSFAPELTGLADGIRKAARYEVQYMAQEQVCGKLRWAKSKFSVRGVSDAACDAFAITAAEGIAKLSGGVVAKISKILGHYRNDETPEIVPSNLKSYGSIIVSNGCDGSGKKLLSQKIFIPWIGENVTRAQMKALANEISVPGVAGFGAIGWEDDEKLTLGAYDQNEVIGAYIKEYEKLTPFISVSADAAPGVNASDPVLGEAA